MGLPRGKPLSNIVNPSIDLRMSLNYPGQHHPLMCKSQAYVHYITSHHAYL
jgi:hypothetical protein